MVAALARHGQCLVAVNNEEVTSLKASPYGSLSTENFLSFLFGKTSTHGLANALLDEPECSRRRSRILRELATYVRTNVQVTDARQRDRLDVAILMTQGIGEVENQLLREQAIVTSLVRLCLELLGGMPNHWDRKVVNKPHHRMIDRHRTLHYSQSVEQRAHLIFDACQGGFLQGLDRRNAPAIWQEYWSCVRTRRFSDFVDWFRSKYPVEFISLFA